MGLWFKSDDIAGKATLADQLIGLDALWPQVRDKKVLDVGCAEGLIAEEVMRHGAKSLRGIDNRRQAIQIALDRNKSLAAHYECADVSIYRPSRYDVILLLGVLHKLSNPAAVLSRMLTACGELCVIRLPGDCWPVLTDSRSGSIPIDLAAIAECAGFHAEFSAPGPVDDERGPQCVIYLRRIAE